jgi:Heavy metal binding domain
MRVLRTVWDPVFAGLVLIAAVHGACSRGNTAVPPTSTAASQALLSAGPDPSKAVAYICPMDRDIRSNAPGKCSRCGMDLVAGVPELVEFHLDLTVAPQPPKPNEPAELTFAVFDPWKNNPVTKFSIVHERLFHAFVVSRDLQFFVHDHPVWQNGVFQDRISFPRPGMYRILSDFYPEAATPQLLTQTVFVDGPEPPVSPLPRDDAPKAAENVGVAVSISPNDPIAGMTTQMRFVLNPPDGIERYLGAWGHMLLVSDDLIDMIHTHPSMADGSAQIQFNLVFPRARTYRLWVQFQRNGIVNTAHFDIPVKSTERPG